LNLYLIERPDDWGYDEYDSAVVCANTEDEARRIHPGNEPDNELYRWNDDLLEWVYSCGEYENQRVSWNSWPVNINSIKVTLLGVAVEDIELGTVCSSFNAG
jgi:hypothetical protein